MFQYYHTALSKSSTRAKYRRAHPDPAPQAQPLDKIDNFVTKPHN
jgi:hypothetical protein